MVHNRKLIPGLLTAVTILAVTQLAAADVFTWKAATPGTWDTGTPNWNDTTTSTNNVDWVDNAGTPNSATFDATATAGTVTMSANHNVGTLSFLTTGWNVTAAAGTGIVAGTGGATFTITSSPGTTNSITARLLAGTGTNPILINGGGTINFNQASGNGSTMSGSTTITGGSTLQLVNITSSALVAGTTVNLNNGTLVVIGSATGVNTGFAHPIALSGSGGSIFYNNISPNGNTWSVQDPWTGSGGLTLGGLGTINLGVSGSSTSFSGGLTIVSGTVTFSLAQGYTGDTTISGGTLRLIGGNDHIPTSSTVYLGQAATASLGTLDLNALNQQIVGLNSIAGTNATASKNTVTSASSATLTLTGSGTYVYGAGTAANSGAITGAVSIVKSGSGTQTFGDTNSYTGATTISNGKLIIGTATGGSAANSAITVQGGGTLGGVGTVKTLSIQSGGHGAPGNSIGTQGMSALTLASGANLDFEFANPDATRLLAVADSASSDRYAVSAGGAAVTAPATGSAILNLIAGAASINTGSYELISYATDTNPVTNWIDSTGTISGGVVTPGVNGSIVLDPTSWSNVAGSFSYQLVNDPANKGVFLDFTSAPVPEPASLAFFTLGAATLLTRRRKA